MIQVEYEYDRIGKNRVLNSSKGCRSDVLVGPSTVYIHDEKEMTSVKSLSLLKDALWACRALSSKIRRPTARPRTKTSEQTISHVYDVRTVRSVGPSVGRSVRPFVKIDEK